MPLLRELSADRELSRAERERAVEIVTNHYRWPDLEIGRERFRDAVFALPAARLRDVAEAVYRECLRRANKVRWGDKTPPYVKIVPQLAHLFPDARFIHLVRDGRDVARSFQETGWYGPWLRDNLREWREALGYAVQWKTLESERKVLSVRYEDLVADTEAAVRRICGFLGEEFEPGMLEWRRGVRRLVPEREQKIHPNLGRPPDSADAARWKRQMNAIEVLVCESFAASELRAFAYPLRYGHPCFAPARLAVRLGCDALILLTKVRNRIGRGVSLLSRPRRDIAAKR